MRAIVVDEVHAFGSDDRGWHLLAVLERISRLAGRPIQRVGLSATIGNPDELLGWLQGVRTRRPASRRRVPRTARQPGPGVTAAGCVWSCCSAVTAIWPVELDYVGSVGNAAHVIASLHHGEKRLVFCDSRQLVEELGAALRDAGVTVFLSHASLSADERHRSEQAFAEARDCVIVSTSTLELGIDVGDLDRVIQVNCPLTVAAFLQRIGRTGRRAGQPPGTACSSPSTASRCCGPPGCCTYGDGRSSSRLFRRRSPGTSSPSSFSRCACRNARSAASSGRANGTACRPSTAARSRSCATWSTTASSTRTARCSSSARPPRRSSAAATSWA